MSHDNNVIPIRPRPTNKRSGVQSKPASLGAGEFGVLTQALTGVGVSLGSEDGTGSVDLIIGALALKLRLGGIRGRHGSVYTRADQAKLVADYSDAQLAGHLNPSDQQLARNPAFYATVAETALSRAGK